VAGLLTVFWGAYGRGVRDTFSKHRFKMASRVDSLGAPGIQAKDLADSLKHEENSTGKGLVARARKQQRGNAPNQAPAKPACVGCPPSSVERVAAVYLAYVA
jgi:hypothetical protein